MNRLAASAACLALLSAPALAKPCPDGSRSIRGADGKPSCPPPRKFEPYDPDRARAGSRPGFYDLGNGTEMRIGGSARGEFTGRR